MGAGVHRWLPGALLVLTCCCWLRRALALTAEPGNWDELLTAFCNVTELPEPGTNTAFLGPLQHINTTRTSYAFYRFGNTTSGRPPLVLINGLASTMHDWAPSMLAALARQQEVLIYDNPGEGLAVELDPPPLLTVQAMAEDALEVYDLLGLEQPNLLGLSMGGMIATALAAEGGGRVGKVVLAPGTAGSPQSGMRDMELWQRMLAGNITFLDFVGGIFLLDTPEGLAAMCQYGLDKAGGIVDPYSAGGFGRHVAAIENFLEGPGTWDQLPDIESPMLLVAGLEDPIIPAQDSVAVVSQLKRPWLALYPGTKHGVLMQQVASVLPLLDNFLAHA